MAYTRNIGKNSSDSHQTSPAYVLTFTRWRNRDTLNYKSEDFLTVRSPLVVVNDAVSIVVTTVKNSPTPTFQCRLRQGDLNYLTAVHPGDFVIVNMVNFEEKAMEIRQRALASKPINKYDDGFKGVFKINAVNQALTVDANGNKEYVVDITARGFDELNTLLYYNPAIVDESNRASPLFFLSQFDKNWKDLVQRKESNNVQNLVKSVIKTTIGTGTKKVVKGDIPQNKIPRYLMPPQLGRLLNRKGKTLYASDINNYYLGIWNPGFSASSNSSGNRPPEQGFNAGFSESGDGNFFDTGSGFELPGSRQIAMQDFQNVKVWSLLKNYSNPVLNETYATYRVAPDGYIYPSIVVRQKPFNNRHYIKNPNKTIHTQFLDLPRWKISSDLITGLNLGRNDSARVNFVQVFTRSLSVDPNFDQAAQIKTGNFVADEDDIKRNGMKPYIATCNYDYPSGTKKIRAKEWANLVSDWLINGHLKMNGSIQSIGIEEPICIGDNLDFDNTVYHIESITHTMFLGKNGNKVFRTNLNLSMGIDDRSTKNIPVYAEMDHTDTLTKRKEDYKDEQVLPGFSDTQDLPGRTRGEEIRETRQGTFTNPRSSDKGKKRD